MADPNPPKLDVNDLRTWRADWDRVGPVLEKLRNQELRQLSPEERLRSLARLLEFGYQFRRPKSVKGWAAFLRRLHDRVR